MAPHPWLFPANLIQPPHLGRFSASPCFFPFGRLTLFSAHHSRKRQALVRIFTSRYSALQVSYPRFFFTPVHRYTTHTVILLSPTITPSFSSREQTLELNFIAYPSLLGLAPTCEKKYANSTLIRQCSTNSTISLKNKTSMLTLSTFRDPKTRRLAHEPERPMTRDSTKSFEKPRYPP